MEAWKISRATGARTDPTTGSYTYATYAVAREGKRTHSITREHQHWVVRKFPEKEDDLLVFFALKIATVKNHILGGGLKEDQTTETSEIALPAITPHPAKRECYPDVFAGDDAGEHLIHMAAWILEFHGALWPRMTDYTRTGICGYAIDIINEFGDGTIPPGYHIADGWLELLKTSSE